MSIVNRRNAILGWAVWQGSKVAAKRKARQAVQPSDGRRGKAAILSAAAATGGALWFWRRRRSDNES